MKYIMSLLYAWMFVLLFVLAEDAPKQSLQEVGFVMGMYFIACSHGAQMHKWLTNTGRNYKHED